MAQVPHVDVEFDGDGTTAIFDFDFPYLKQSEIFVSVDGVNVDYTWLAGNTHSVQVLPAPALGTRVRIYRSTLAIVPLHVFAAGVPFLPRYVDENNKQLLYVMQEAVDATAGTAAEALETAEEAKVLAQEANDKVDGAIIDSAFALRTELATSVGSAIVGYASGSSYPVGSIGAYVQELARSVVGLKDLTRIDVWDYLSAAEQADVEGPSVLDHTAAIVAALTAAFASLPAVVNFRRGRYNYTALPNCAKTGLTLRGAGERSTYLRCTGSGAALTLDAFANGSESDPFVFSCNLQSMTISGNATSTSVVYAQGIAAADWHNVSTMNAEPTNGVGLFFKGVMLGRFTEVRCSVDFQPMTSKPRYGIRMVEGRRGPVGSTASVGNSSCNNFQSSYFDGLPICGDLAQADQTTFTSGAFQSASVYGLITGTNSRYNTFLGVGLENVASTADVADGGIQSQFLNCYTSNKFLGQGRQGIIRGGYHEAVALDAGSSGYITENITVKHWGTGHGGYTDAGVNNRVRNVWDSQANAYIYPKKSRTGITVTASPFTYRNNTGGTIELIIQAGGVTQLRKGDGTGDLWLTGNITNGSHILLADDVMEVSYSTAPAMSMRVLNIL